MNRTNICKNIVQSIKDYITDQVKLEPHRVEKHFVENILYGEENFHFCKLLFICSSLQKLPCSRIFHRSEKNWARFLFRMFLNRHFPKPDSSLILHCSRNFIIFLLICFTARSLQESCGRVIIFCSRCFQDRTS